MRRPLASAILLACAAAPPLFAQAPDLAAIDSAVEAEFARGRVPGGAVVVVRGDSLHTYAFGRADGTGRPVTAQTPFYLGSTTKSFTALAVLQLADEGRVELDAPVQRYVPWFTLADSAFSRGITVRQLLVHNSGIPGRAGEYWLDDPDTSATAEERHVWRLASLEPVHRFDYSNTNYTTLGLVAAAASGMPYSEYLRARVLAPLDMRHSHTERADAIGDGLTPGYRMVLGFPMALGQPANRGDLAAGYLISSAEDVGHYLIAHLNHGRYGGRLAVSARAVEESHRVRAPIVSDRNITYGFSETTLEGVHILDASGSVPNYLSRFVLSPDSGWGVAVLANGQGVVAEEHVMEAALNAARMVMGKPAVPVAVPLVIVAAVALFLLFPVLQLALAVRTLRRLRDHVPTRWRGIVLPAVGGTGLGALFLIGLPFGFQSYLRIMRLYQPDLGWAVTWSGWFALVWGGARTVLAVRRAARV